MQNPIEYKTGTLAYTDVPFSGLIPCKVISVRHDAESHCDIITVKLTATRKAYRKGEVLDFAAWSVIPRNHIFTRSGRYYIRDGYKWVNA